MKVFSVATPEEQKQLDPIRLRKRADLLKKGKGDGTFELPRIIPLTKGLDAGLHGCRYLRGNGILDLIVAEFDTSSIGVLLGNGDGTFSYEQLYSLPQPPSALVLDDFNHDGKLDIAAVMVTQNSNTVGGNTSRRFWGTGLAASQRQS